MRQLLFVIAAGLGLAACSPQQMVADKDDRDCRAKGFEAGSVAYVDCRTAIDKQRAETQARAYNEPHYRCPPRTNGGFALGQC